MKKAEHRDTWTTCPDCQGRGKKSGKLRKSLRLRFQQESEEFEKTGKGSAPVRPKAHLSVCVSCAGSGLIQAIHSPKPDKENYPHLAIIGGGIGGVALAVACLHRGIPFTLYERDENFEARSQGYGLTLQQAHQAIKGFGISKLKEGIISTRHLVHTPEGKVIGEWGMRKWMAGEEKKEAKRTNVHIARQSLRSALLEQLGGSAAVQWGHQLTGLKENKNGIVDLEFQVNGKIKKANADLVVAADGIRSAVRSIIIGEERTPLRYLNCIVILGICPLEYLNGLESPLLDGATVFQTANGNERIYMMPYSSDSVMWQLSFPMTENEAKALSSKGSKALKEEALRRLPWHDPIPQILKATPENKISGYPVYDRELLESELLKAGGSITLIGDAAHPMSPFKGQGANQALLDALALARAITKNCRPKSNWREKGIRESVLNDSEAEMLERSAVKVKDSEQAAQFLHTETVLKESNKPRGKN